MGRSACKARDQELARMRLMRASIMYHMYIMSVVRLCGSECFPACSKGALHHRDRQASKSNGRDTNAIGDRRSPHRPNRSSAPHMQPTFQKKTHLDLVHSRRHAFERPKWLGGARRADTIAAAEWQRRTERALQPCWPVADDLLDLGEWSSAWWYDP